MAYETIRQVLEDARKLHHELEALYRKQAETAEQDKMRRILDFMGRHEAALDQWMSEVEADAPQKMLDTRLHFMPDISECGDAGRASLPANATVDEAIRIALRFDDCLVAYYRELAEGPVPKDVQELFRFLLKGERSEEREVIESALLMSEP